MKNKEKFRDKIVDIACNDGRLAVDVETNTPVDCNSIDCSGCLFNDKGGCSSEIFNWSEQEYKEPIVISSKDSITISYIKDKFKYISRDKNGTLYVYVNEPKKLSQSDVWTGKGVGGIDGFDFVLPMVKWTDEHAWKISDLKELKIVENY